MRREAVSVPEPDGTKAAYEGVPLREILRAGVPLAARGRSPKIPERQAKPPVPPNCISSLRRWWDRHAACRDFCHGLLGNQKGGIDENRLCLSCVCSDFRVDWRREGANGG